MRMSPDCWSSGELKFPSNSIPAASICRDCLSRLPDDQRQLVRGYYFDDETIDALATRLGRGSDAIYKSLQRIRQALHQCIERKLQAET